MAFVWAIFLSICYAGSCASSIGSSLHCSKYHFEEKVLEKLIRLELKMEMYEAKIKTWEDSIPTNLDKIDNAKKQTETFLESMRDILQREQTRLNGSFHETVENVYLKSENKVKSALDLLSYKIEEYSESLNRGENALELLRSSFRQEQTQFKQEQIRINNATQETVENIYRQSESKVKSVLDSLSTKIGDYEKRGENALKLLHSTLLQEQQRFNDSFQVTVNNIKTQPESKVKSILESISFKMNEFSKSHSKREDTLERLQSNFLQEQERFNQSFHLMMNNIKEDLNETIRNFISAQADDRDLQQECTDMSGEIIGIHTISPDKIHKFKARCEDGNWAVIQKRFNGETEFYRNWNDYENGFGNLFGEFWLGDGMTQHNGYYFSTYDRDHDTRPDLNCAAAIGIKGAWWFHGCWRSGNGASLNGKYTSRPSYNAGIIYRTWKSKSLKKSTMMIRRV